MSEHTARTMTTEERRRLYGMTMPASKGETVCQVTQPAGCQNPAAAVLDAFGPERMGAITVTVVPPLDAIIAECPACAESQYEACREHRLERVTVAELAAGDVIEHSDGGRSVVEYVGPVERVGPRSYRYVSGTGMTSGSFRLGNRYDRLTDAAKRAAGYPHAEHDVPSEREPRDDADHIPACERCAAMNRALQRTGEPTMTDTERAGLHTRH